jgi:hypothetical protein
MRRIFGFLLVLLGSSGYHSVMAQSTGSFTVTGNMITPRAGHTATLLTNGKVLIAGGAPSVPASAELFDPVPGTFAATGNMIQGRVNHTATLLPDGEVLIVGGCLSTFGECILPALSSAELYDPVTGNFTPTGSMTTGRAWGFTATLLSNGKVLIVGGTPDPSRGFFVATDAELYDPLTGNFARTGDLNVRREGHTATLLANGKVLIAGGVDSGDEAIASAELYDPETGTFTPTGGIGGGAASVQRATLLPDGTVFGLAHVENLFSYGDYAERYDPSTGSFSDAGNRLTLKGAPIILLSDGRVLLTGIPLLVSVYSYSPTDDHSADLYDPVKRTFSTVGDLNTPRGAHTATLLSDGTVLIAGGSSSSFPYVFLASAEIYHPAVSKPAPVLYSLPGDGFGQGAILHAGTAQVASPSYPAAVGEILESYGAGLLDGGVTPPQVSIGGRPADVLFFGKAPGFDALDQINVRVPGGVASGPAVPVRLNYLGRPSNEVTIGVR